ncbi:MAG TPA: hypothetical protein VF383_08505 [Candidatus Dormibacteraeota bacterium]
MQAVGKEARHGDSQRPFQGAPFNPCTIGNIKGGRVVKVSLAEGDD